jgi:hypothetical protein
MPMSIQRDERKMKDYAKNIAAPTDFVKITNNSPQN